MSDNVMTLAQVVYRLRKARQARDMSQAELAGLAGEGLTMQQVSQIELGKRNLSLAEYLALCRALGIDAARALRDEPLPIAYV